MTDKNFPPQNDWLKDKKFKNLFFKNINKIKCSENKFFLNLNNIGEASLLAQK